MPPKLIVIHLYGKIGIDAKLNIVLKVVERSASEEKKFFGRNE